MARTIAEKILETHLVDDKQKVEPGNVVRARADLVLLNDINGPVTFRHFANMGVGDVVCPDKLALVVDHFAPAPNALGAQLSVEMRRFAQEKGIKHFFDLGKGGIEHTLIPEQGLIGPGDIVIGGDSHSTTSARARTTLPGWTFCLSSTRWVSRIFSAIVRAITNPS